MTMAAFPTELHGGQSKGFPMWPRTGQTIFWTHAQRLVDAPRSDLRPLILIGLYTGCRAAELDRVTAADLLEEQMAIYVQPVESPQERKITLPNKRYHLFKSLTRGSLLVRSTRHWYHHLAF